MLTGELIYNTLRQHPQYAALKPWNEIDAAKQEAWANLSIMLKIESSSPIVLDPNIKDKMQEGFHFLNQAAKRSGFMPMDHVLKSVRDAYTCFEVAARLMENQP